MMLDLEKFNEEFKSKTKGGTELTPDFQAWVDKCNSQKTIMEEQLDMATLKETAMAYEPPQTLNIADLEKVPVDVQVETKTSKNKDGEEFTYKYCVFNEKEYRIPNSVLEEIQTILKLKPDVQFVKVNKSGSGLATRYKVEPAE